MKRLALCTCLLLLPAATASADAVSDSASLLSSLRARGARVEAVEQVDQPFLSVGGTLIKLDGQDVQVFEYPSEAQLQAQAKSISSDGSTIGTSKIHWLAPPHFFRQGRVLVLYVGDDAMTISALEAALGEQFAGQ